VGFATLCPAPNGADLERPIRSGAKPDWNAPARRGADLNSPGSSDFVRPAGSVAGWRPVSSDFVRPTGPVAWLLLHSDIRRRPELPKLPQSLASHPGIFAQPSAWTASCVAS
jgi:hypothetical protein